MRRRTVLLTLLLLVFAALAWWLVASLRGTPSERATPVAGAAGPGEQVLVLRGRAGPVAPEAEAVAPESESGGVRIVGRVFVEAGGSPAVGARVLARAEGRDVAEGVTNDEGRLAVPYGPRPPYEVGVSLTVTAADGMATTAVVPLHPQSPDVVDAGVLLLRPTTALTIRTLHDGKPVAGAHVYACSVPLSDRPRTDVSTGSSDGEPTFPFQTVSNAAGRARFERLPVGAVRVLALADGPLRGETLVSTDRAEAPVEVRLVTARDLRVQVVWQGDGAPIPECVLLVRGPPGRPLGGPGPLPVTNEMGIAVIPAVRDDEAVDVVVNHPDWCSAYMSGLAATAEAGTSRLRIEVPRPLTLRVPIRVADGPHPADGTRVELIQDDWGFWPGNRIGLARFGSIVESHLVVDLYRVSYERATARLPDGRVGGLLLAVDYDQQVKQSRPRLPLEEVVFTRPRHVSVEVRERGTGHPAVGVAARAFLSGAEREMPSVFTDGSGEARIEGIPSVRGWVSICANPELVLPHRQGIFSQRRDIDLRDGDAHLVFEVQPVQEAVVRVTTEGRSVLPAGFEAAVWLLPEGLTPRRSDDLVVDRERSEVRFRFRPPMADAPPPVRIYQRWEALLRLTSDTCATEYVSLDPGKPLRAAIDLQPAGALLTKIVAPEDLPLQARLQVRREGEVWKRVWEGPVEPFPGEASEGKLYVALRPGAYRLYDENLRESSDEVEVHPGPDPATLVWDLTPKAYAEGEVILPPGIDPMGLRIFVHEPGDPTAIVGFTSVLDSTHFRVRVPTDRPVDLRAVHPGCRPDDQEGSATVTGATTGLILRLVPRPR